MTALAIEFDFSSHVDRELPFEQVTAALADGKSCWVDIDLTQHSASQLAMQALSINPQVIEALEGSPSAGRHDVYEDCLHFSISIPVYIDRQVSFEIIELIIADRLLVTLRRGASPFVDRIRASYPNFFRKFALSLGFLLFEIWDLLIETFRRVLAVIEEDVEQIQKSVFVGVSEEIFQSVSQLTISVLEVRKATLAMHDSLEQLATHKSSFVAPTAQPYLLNMVGSLERLASDSTIQRETLAEALTLYLGMVSHRTNQLVHRLTLVSLVFLPLTFLCGLYGVNFDLPEFNWKYGFLFFWSLLLMCVGGMVTWLRTQRMW